MKTIIFLFCIIQLCSCSTNFSNEDPCIEIPLKVKLISARIIFYPDKNSNNGLPWDIDSLEDIYLVLKSFDRELIYQSKVFENTRIDSSLNLISSSSNVIIEKPLETINWEIFDKEENSIVSGIDFGDQLIDKGTAFVYRYTSCSNKYAAGNEARLEFEVEYLY